MEEVECVDRIIGARFVIVQRAYTHGERQS